jgi:hypothetical protein
LPTLKKYLRRYTDLPALIHLLTEKQLTLLDPDTWDDKNDSYFLTVYREKNKLQSLLALCFTQHTETYHHWRVFANGPSGVCITFSRERLLRAVKKCQGIRAGEVEYLRLADTRGVKPAIRDLPFMKRAPFEHEKEFRIVVGSRLKMPSFPIPIPLSSIDRVTLSPWLNAALSVYVKKTLWRIKGCEQLDIARSTLISNEEWKSFGDTAVSRKPASSK